MATTSDPSAGSTPTINAEMEAIKAKLAAVEKEREKIAKEAVELKTQLEKGTKEWGEKEATYEKELTEKAEQLGTVEEELEQRKAQLSTIAMAEFEKEKKVLVEQVKTDLGEEKAKEVETMIGTEPKNLENTKLWIGMLKAATEAAKKAATPTPISAGLVPLPTPTVGAKPTPSDEDMLREIDRVYTEYKHQLRLQRQGRHDPVKLAELERERKTLWASFIEGIKGPRVKKEAIVAELPTIMYCPQCKFPLIGERKCRKCGFDLTTGSPEDLKKWGTR